jgi:exodeoxyribonuclease VII large subunit
MAARLEHERSAVAAWQQSLAHLSPQAVLARGYSLVRDADGRIVSDSRALTVGSRVALHFSAGSASALVDRIDSDQA